MSKDHDALADMLNHIADADDPQSELRKIARMFLACEDGAVRAATGRALHVIDPAMAIALISERLADEPNKVVRAIFQGAIRSALIILEERKTK